MKCSSVSPPQARRVHIAGIARAPDGDLIDARWAGCATRSTIATRCSRARYSSGWTENEKSLADLRDSFNLWS